MYDLRDLPYDPNLQDMPNTFTPFRNKVEKNCKIRSPLAISKGLGSLPNDSSFCLLLEKYGAEVPSLQDLAYTSDQIDHANSHDTRGVMEFKGGETAALARVKDYIWDKDLLRKYFDTRNGMIGADYSTKVRTPLCDFDVELDGTTSRHMSIIKETVVGNTQCFLSRLSRLHYQNRTYLLCFPLRQFLHL